jgi:hypothetical protein
MNDDIGFQTIMRPDESADATNLELEKRVRKGRENRKTFKACI